MPWLQHPTTKNIVLVPEHMPETIERCQRDGWVVVPSPLAPAVLQPAPATTNTAPAVAVVVVEPVEVVEAVVEPDEYGEPIPLSQVRQRGRR